MSVFVPGKGGDRYVPYEERTGRESVVYFTRDLSPEGLLKIFDRVSPTLKGKIAIKLHTGEAHGPNIIPRPFVRRLIEERLEDATIIETNTYYQGDRYTTEQHRETLKVNGWNFCPVDIIDEFGTARLPVKGGKWFTYMSVGEGILKYDSMLTLTHFKGHTMGGFGGSNKNIGIGCADGRIGKKMIHTATESDNMWSIAEEELMERISESTKATIDHFGDQVVYINVLRNISVDCDCAGVGAKAVETPDIGIVASTDILAADQACVDMIYALPNDGGAAMKERIETRHGHRQLSYMKELRMGNNRYGLVDIDNEDKVITAAEAVKDIQPGWTPDQYNTPTIKF